MQKCIYCDYERECSWENEGGPCGGDIMPAGFEACHDENDNVGLHCCQNHQYMIFKDVGSWWLGNRGYVNDKNSV